MVPDENWSKTVSTQNHKQKDKPKRELDPKPVEITEFREFCTDFSELWMSSLVNIACYFPHFWASYSLAPFLMIKTEGYLESRQVCLNLPDLIDIFIGNSFHHSIVSSHTSLISSYCFAYPDFRCRHISLLACLVVSWNTVWNNCLCDL